jgi:hypothetical protein
MRPESVRLPSPPLGASPSNKIYPAHGRVHPRSAWRFATSRLSQRGIQIAEKVPPAILSFRAKRGIFLSFHRQNPQRNSSLRSE